MLRYALLLGLLCGLLMPLRAADVNVQADPPVDVVLDKGAKPPKPKGEPITVAIRTEKAGNLFTPGETVGLTTFITNPGAEQAATVTTVITAEFGCIVYAKKERVTLPANNILQLFIYFPGNNRLPNGSYLAEVAVAATDGIAYGDTLYSVWPGAAEQAYQSFGIAYVGALDNPGIVKDLDLFKAAGVGWLRFPLHGWLPQGEAQPFEAQVYNNFVVEADKRGFNLLAAFTPKITVDPSVDSARADKDYRESVMAAAVRYGFKVKWWELLRVKPDVEKSPEMKGIGYPMLKNGRDALRSVDKSLKALYSVEDPFKWNAMELFHNNVPVVGDGVSLRYNFVGIPEVKTNPESPAFSITDLEGAAMTALKRRPPLWVTEYGFDPRKADHLPGPQYQAALVARALVLDRLVGIERTFWRHQPGSPYDLPLTRTDGSAMPSLLALRTTMAALADLTEIKELPSPIAETRVFIIKHGGEKKAWYARTKKATYSLALWSTGGPGAMALKSKATRMSVTDLWGNAIELKPTSGVAIVQVDEFPRFVDLDDTPDVELFSSFARFLPSKLVLREDGLNTMTFVILNDQRLFNGNISLELNFRRWPEEPSKARPSDPTKVEPETPKVRTEKVNIDPAGRIELDEKLTIPANAHKGHLFNYSVEVLLGTRRIGYLTLPVWYSPTDDR
jgi:hypothetical protein